jgi:microcystin-dependent protein
MSDPFVAQISMFPFNFAPKAWALCDGQLLSVSQNSALFSLIGTYYGGDGKVTFALPNLQGQAVVGQGQSPGTSQYSVGETIGVPTVTLLQSEMPQHNHGLVGTTDKGTTATSSGNQLAHAFAGIKSQSFTGEYMNTATNPQTGMIGAFGPTGSSFPHNNMQPYLVLNFCISMQGVYPARP